jgi:hypothetical protein
MLNGLNTKRSFKVISHTPESIDTWLNELHKTAKGNIAVAVELTKGHIVYALQKYSFVTVFPIHGLTYSETSSSKVCNGIMVEFVSI